jgi:coproporphyrinogen III oxidase
MKLLTKLRELRTQNSVDQLFDDFHFTVELHRDETMGIGTTTYDDIQRLDIAMIASEKTNFSHK